MPPVFDTGRADRVLDGLRSRAPDFATCEPFRSIIASAAGNSPYLGGLLLKQSGFLGRLFTEGPQPQLERLNAEVRAVAGEESVVAAQKRLRVAKQQLALTIALADICGIFDLTACMAELTRFADGCVAGALRCQLEWEARSEHVSTSPPAEQSGLVVLAMGKMGALELNYSSDIDLVIFFDERRFVFARAGDRQMAAVGVVKGLVNLLSATTSDGYVFRVDLRLRPDAGATQVAISTAAAETYYESMGQNWERAAWIKARPCAGDVEAAARAAEPDGAVHLAQASRLCRDPGHPFHQAADPQSWRARPDCGRQATTSNLAAEEFARSSFLCKPSNSFSAGGTRPCASPPRLARWPR